MKRKTPKVEAWCVVAGTEVLAGFSRESEALSRRLDEAALRSDHTLRVVHLVEDDPAKERALRAAERWADHHVRLLNTQHAAKELVAAVEKLPKGRRK